MTRPETCGAAGGAISVWMKINDCPSGDGGIVMSSAVTTGAIIYCQVENIRYNP